MPMVRIIKLALTEMLGNSKTEYRIENPFKRANRRVRETSVRE